MKRLKPAQRRDRITGKGSPYVKHGKAPFHYSFPTGKERMAEIEREGAKHVTSTAETGLSSTEAEERRSLERSRRRRSREERRYYSIHAPD